MTLPPRAVLFDWDGTLVNSWPVIHESMNRTLETMGYPQWTFEETLQRVRKSLREAFPELFGDRWEAARDVFHQNEVEQSTYNFEHADVPALFAYFDQCEKESQYLIEQGLALPAYEKVMKASHYFNLLDARHAISVTERQRYILRVRTLSKAVAEAYYAAREALGFPLCKDKA